MKYNNKFTSHLYYIILFLFSQVSQEYLVSKTDTPSDTGERAPVYI
jgi:hypothetical protein